MTVREIPTPARIRVEAYARLHSLLAEAQDNTHNSLQKNRTRLLDIATDMCRYRSHGERSRGRRLHRAINGSRV